MPFLVPRIFFFSSRRRHTILVSDWSSDVCSSDLELKLDRQADIDRQHHGLAIGLLIPLQLLAPAIRVVRIIGDGIPVHRPAAGRSEERRVGNGWRDRGWRGGSEENGR